MRKITATGYDEYIEEGRPTLYVSSGFGNTHGLPEIHLHMYDPSEDVMVQFWVPKDLLLQAVLDPNPDVEPSPTLGAVDAEVEL